MKRRLIPMSVALGAILLGTAAPMAAEPDRAYPIAAQGSVGSWTLIAANDPSGAFHHCELSRQQGNYQVSFLRGTAGYVLVVANAGWQLPDGASYTVSLEGDGLDRVDYKASTAGTGIIILLGEDWQIVGKLRDVGTLQLHAAQAVIPLAMNEAGAALDQLEACWTQRTGAVSNPFAASDSGPADANPFENSSSAVAGDPAANSSGFSIAVADITASGSNFSDAEIGKMLEGDFARLVELTADRVTVPEITTRFIGAGADPVEVVYRDVSFSGIAGGQASGVEVGSVELHSADTAVALDHVSTGQLNIAGLLGFYGLAAPGQQDAVQLLYKDFAIDGVSIELPGASCRLGPIEAAEFSARPLHVTPAESVELMQDMQNANGAPTAKQIGGFARLYADYLTAFQSGPLQVSDLACTTENASGETVTLTADRLGMEGLQPNRIPGIEARNLKLEVGDQGSFAAQALILKPADASGLVATLLAAGDNPAPSWLADNARALIPAFAGLQLAGVTLDVPDTSAPGERMRIGLTEADLSLGSYRNGIPTDVEMSAFGIDIPLKGEDMQPLADMGYPTVNLDMTLATHWDAATNQIVLDHLVVSGQDMGMLALVATLTNATPDLFSSDSARAFGAALLLGVQSIGIKVEDAGLRDRLIAAGASSADVTPDVFATQLAGLMPTYVPQGRDWSDEVEQAAVAFIKGAPSVAVGLGADTPVAAAQLLATQSNPAGVLDLFDITARAGD